MADLSPAAQAVFNAAWTCPIVLGDHPTTRSRQIAAALRAAADQVVPETTTPWSSTLTPMISAGEVRAKFLAIAAELEAAQ
jgi:hypothetical protein